MEISFIDRSSVACHRYLYSPGSHEKSIPPPSNLIFYRTLGGHVRVLPELRVINAS